MSTMSMPRIDAALAAGRAYLTGKLEDPLVLSEFETALEGLRKTTAQIRSEVAAHAEFLANAGRIRSEQVPGFRAELEKYALGHRDRMLTVLANTYSEPKADGEHAVRLGKLLNLIALERAREA